MLTPRQRVENVLKGKPVDRVPFTVYFNMIFMSQAERELRNEGLCPVVYKGIFPYAVETHDVDEEVLIFRGDDGIMREKRSYHTNCN